MRMLQEMLSILVRYRFILRAKRFSCKCILNNSEADGTWFV